MYVWAYERSTQEYMAIKQDLMEPDPIRLAYRQLIKQTVRDIVTQPEKDALTVIQQTVVLSVNDSDRDNVQALIIEELRRLHEGVLARYGLRPSELYHWQSVQHPR